jgi:hypothetical protein
MILSVDLNSLRELRARPSSFKRDLLYKQKRPTVQAKETY